MSTRSYILLFVVVVTISITVFFFFKLSLTRINLASIQTSTYCCPEVTDDRCRNAVSDDVVTSLMVGDGQYDDSPDDGDGRTHGMQRGAGRGRLLLPRRRSLLPAARFASQPRATRLDCCSSSATRQLRSHAGMYTRPSRYFSTPVRNRIGGRCKKRRTARLLPRDPIVR